MGANGAGKSTLLQLLAGKFMVSPDTVRVLGRPAFHDLALTASGTLGYLGPQWRRDVASAGSNVPMQAGPTIAGQQRLHAACQNAADMGLAHKQRASLCSDRKC